MNNQDFGEDRPVTLVSNIDEGRLEYIADMAGELARMAGDAGERWLADTLRSAQREAIKMAKMEVKES